MLTKEAKLNNNNANKSPINTSATRQLALGVSGFRMKRNWNDVALRPAPLMRYAEITKASENIFAAKIQAIVFTKLHSST